MPPYRPPKSGNLPPRGKRILREVYTASRHKYPGEIAANKARSARIAWSAVEKAGYHKVGKNWRLK
jgi:hypothetical protein